MTLERFRVSACACRNRPRLGTTGYQVSTRLDYPVSRHSWFRLNGPNSTSRPCTADTTRMSSHSALQRLAVLTYLGPPPPRPAHHRWWQVDPSTSPCRPACRRWTQIRGRPFGHIPPALRYALRLLYLEAWFFLVVLMVE